jgi:hypothetical protein
MLEVVTSAKVKIIILGVEKPVEGMAAYAFWEVVST